MRASRKKVKGRIEEREGVIRISLLTSSNLAEAFPEPLKFFVRKEFRRYRGCQTDQWWDGSLWSRGETSDQSGLFQGIPPELRVETDYQVTAEGRIQANSNFSPSEYSQIKQRRRRSLTIPTPFLPQIRSLFLTYLNIWNELVTLDKANKLIGVSSEADLFERKVVREYIKRRSMSNGPLRYKNLDTLNSIPVVHDQLDLRPLIKQVADLRSYISGRIIKRSNRKYQISFVYSEVRIKEVDLSDDTINFCRDPRLRDVGVAFSSQGLSVVVQNALDGRKYFTIKPEVLANTKNFLDSFFSNINGKVRSVALDSSCSVPKYLVELRKKFIKKCRTMKAEGAAAFYEAPKLIPLGQTYRDDLPAHDPRHLKVWAKKAFKEVKDYALIQGLTGEHMLVEPSLKGPIAVNGRVVSGLVMANHTLLQAMAKWDMWPGATFLSSASCRTVRKGLNRS